jgi:hypothetical protein
VDDFGLSHDAIKQAIIPACKMPSNRFDGRLPPATGRFGFATVHPIPRPKDLNSRARAFDVAMAMTGGAALDLNFAI